MADLSISRAWDATREHLARDGKLIASVALALILLPQAVAGLISPPSDVSAGATPGWMPLFMLLLALIGLIGQLAIARLALVPGTTVAESIAVGLKRLLSTFAALLLFGILLMLLLIPIVLLLVGPEDLQAATAGRPTGGFAMAILLFSIIALLIGVRLQLVVPVAAAETGGPIHLLKRSWQLTRNHYWKLLGFIVLVVIAVLIVLFAAQMLAMLLGAVLFGEIEPMSVGALVVALITAAAQAAFSAVITVMLARIYVQVTGSAQVEATVPSSGT